MITVEQFWNMVETINKNNNIKGIDINQYIYDSYLKMLEDNNIVYIQVTQPVILIDDESKTVVTRRYDKECFISYINSLKNTAKHYIWSLIKINSVTPDDYTPRTMLTIRAFDLE